MELTEVLLNLQAWIVFIVVFVISYNYIVKESWKGLPPGPPTLPLVGSLPFLGADVREPFRKMAAKYGDVFTVYLGKTRTVVLNGYDTLKEAHLKHGNVLLARPDGFFNTHLSGSQGLVASSGPLWNEQHTFTLHTFRQLGFGRPIMENKITEEIQYFIKELHKQKDDPFYPLKLLHRSVANITFSVLFGKRREYTDAEYIRFIHTMETIMRLLGSGGVIEVFPFVRYLPGDLFGIKELRKLTDSNFAGYQRIIDQHKASEHDEDNPTDFIAAYLHKIKMEKDNPKSTFTEKQLQQVIHDIFLAGSETASTTLTWAILYMSVNQDIQSRVQEEIDDVIGKGGIPSMLHRLKMPYSEACLNEIQRLGDVAPLAAPRRLTGDVTIKGYFIPEGTSIISNLNGINYDPRYWPEPDVFKPERFLGVAGNSRKRDEFIPFMIGKRSCIGENLGRMELFLYFTSMMANFRFRVAPGYPEPDRRGVLGATTVPKPFYVLAESRT